MRGATLAAALCAGFFLADVANADPITLRFSGLVTERIGHFPEKIEIGDVLVGSFTIDTASLTASQRNDPFQDQFQRFDGPAAFVLSFNHGGDSTTNFDVPRGQVDIVINNDVSGLDAFRAVLSTGFAAEHALNFGLTLLDSTGQIFPSTDLPVNFDFNPRSFDTRFFDGSFVTNPPFSVVADFHGAFTSLNGVEVTATPEPATISLAVFGLAGLVATCGRRRNGAASTDLRP